MKRLSLFLLLCGLFAFSCSDNPTSNNENINYKEEMRNFVIEISNYAKQNNDAFIIVPQNGQELVTEDGNETGTPHAAYLQSIDGVGREDLFYGYSGDNIPTPDSEREYMISFLDICENNGVEVLTTDYCVSREYVDSSYAKNSAKGYISFAAPARELTVIPGYPPTPFGFNYNPINSLSDAANFLYLINPENFVDKNAFLDSLIHTDYDIIIMDLFFNEEELTAADIDNLKLKYSGAKRMVLAYMSIGEAEDYRFYWQASWDSSPPSWLAEENPAWEGNYKVKYWDEDWKKIIFGTENSYLDKIINAGFDGVYLDIIDAFEYFEER